MIIYYAKSGEHQYVTCPSITCIGLQQLTKKMQTKQLLFAISKRTTNVCYANDFTQPTRSQPTIPRSLWYCDTVSVPHCCTATVYHSLYGPVTMPEYTTRTVILWHSFTLWHCHKTSLSVVLWPSQSTALSVVM